jgi:transposase-like protein
MALHRNGKRERATYDTGFKARVATAYLTSDFTMEEVAAKYGVDMSLVSTWSRKVVEALEDKRGGPPPDGWQFPKKRAISCV